MEEDGKDKIKDKDMSENRKDWKVIVLLSVIIYICRCSIKTSDWLNGNEEFAGFLSISAVFISAIIDIVVVSVFYKALVVCVPKVGQKKRAIIAGIDLLIYFSFFFPLKSFRNMVIYDSPKGTFGACAVRYYMPKTDCQYVFMCGLYESNLGSIYIKGILPEALYGFHLRGFRRYEILKSGKKVTDEDKVEEDVTNIKFE